MSKAESSDRVDPPILDGLGYAVRERDLSFLGIAPGDVAAWRTRQRPLGLSDNQFRALRHGLRTALAADDIPLDECDVRLQGSSAFFFSGHHKPMVHDRDDLIDTFRSVRRRLPDDWEVTEIEDRLRNQWITDGEFPGRRPFNSMFMLGVDREPSDYDLQISSDALVDRCEHALVDLGQEPSELRTMNAEYNFIRKDLVEDVAPALYRYTRRMSDALGRAVSVAVFRSDGPPECTDRQDGFSSHFRDTDWILDLTPDSEQT